MPQNKKTDMKKGLLLISGLAISALASAQISITTGSLSYSQDFNTLDSNATNSSNLPAGFALHENGSGSSANDMYRSGDGNSNAGDTYSYGSVANADRALGSLGSGSVQAIFGVQFTNNTGSTINSVDVNFTGEEWRFGGLTGTRTGADSLLFQYSTSATSVGDTNASASWVQVPDLLLLSPNLTSPSGALDGNDGANRTTVNGTVTLSLPDGGSIYFRWVDLNIGGSDDGLAVDDLTMTFATGSGPACAAPTGLTETNVTPFSADLSWNAVTGAQSYEFVVDNSSTPPAASGTNTTATSYSASSLTPSTVYFLHVRTVCGATEFSAWSNYSFTTMTDGISNLSQNALGFAVVGVPTSDVVNLLFNASSNQPSTVSILDVTGRLVHTSTILTGYGTNARQLSGLSLAPGIYSVRLSNAQQSAVVKIAVQ